MGTRPDDLIYAVDEWPPWPKLVLLGLQQAILAAVYLVLIVIVARAAGAPDHTAMAMVSLGMIAVAISSSLQALWKGPVGSGYLAVPVFSAIYLAPAILAAKAGGLPAVFGMTVFAGLIEVALSRNLHRLRALFPPAISGLVVGFSPRDRGFCGSSKPRAAELVAPSSALEDRDSACPAGRAPWPARRFAGTLPTQDISCSSGPFGSRGP